MPRRLAALALLALLGCTVNPATGQREIVLMSAQEEARAGAEAAKQVEQEMGLVRDAALAAYVQAVGSRLAALSPRRDVEYRFHVVNMPESNAFALPGGYIYVSRGLLALSRSEDELANVLAHEIGHVAARHSAQRQTRAAGVGLLSVLGTIAAGALGGAGAAQTVAQLGQVAGAGLIASYGRDQEREADRIGQQVAARAGYDPAAMSTFLSSLQRETELVLGRSPRPSFLDSHPSTPERVANAASLAKTLQRAPAAGIAATRAAYLARLEGLLVGPDPAGGLVRDSVFLHPKLDFRIRFPAEWQVQNTDNAVAAIAPRGDAGLQLQLQGRGSDPREAARQFLANQRVEIVDSGSIRIQSLAGYRVRAIGATQQGGRVGADMVWIAYRGMIYRLQGIAPEKSFLSYADLFQKSALSFRPLTPDELALCRERRLHVVAAREGETIAELSTRSGNAWSAAETSVMNGLNLASRLHASEPVKVVVERSWRP
jgi:predicted Zn-dependent protease